MKVMKFGGSSVGSVNSLLNVKKIVEGCNEPVIVVVSALGGVTDLLIQMANTASVGDDIFKVNFQELQERHEQVMNGLFKTEELEEVRFIIRGLLEELSNIFKGIYLIRDLSDRSEERR